MASAGWALTTERVAKGPEGLDLAGLLDVIEAGMKDAPDRLQWAMNHCLAQIGIEHAEHRARATGIGERLEVLKDYPTRTAPLSSRPPGSPRWYAGSTISRKVRAHAPGIDTNVPPRVRHTPRFSSGLYRFGRSGRSGRFGECGAVRHCG